MRILSSFLIGSLLVCTSIIALETPSFTEVTQVIPIQELTLEKSQLFLDGDSQGLVLFCEEGTKIPIRAFGHYGLFSARWLPNLELQIEKTCYFRMAQNQAYFSYDLVEWQEMSKLLEGIPSFGIRLNPEDSALELTASFGH